MACWRMQWKKRTQKSGNNLKENDYGRIYTKTTGGDAEIQRTVEAGQQQATEQPTA